LKQNLDDLAELKAGLEQKVKERTRELEEIHAKLRHTEKLSAMGRLSASIAHEITNPLNVMLTQLHLWRRQEALPDDPSLPEPVDVIERHVEMIVELMDQLRSFSRPPREGRQSVNLNDVVESVLALTAQELRMHHIEVGLDLDPALPSVQASENQLEEVFMNLILNARDAMPDGGDLTICTEAGESWVYAKVRDTGVGIAPELQARVFEPFFTTKGEEGTGLGLAISHSIIDEHDGEINLESRIGHGTIFKLCLPTHAG
jgi:two-component system NtrC family sensor kinase